jgi:proteasome lid subunit RPN8/RPN11
LRGVRVETTAVGLEGAGEVGEPVSCEIPKSYFTSLAEHGSREWVDKGKLAAGELYTYRVCAYPIATDFSEADTRRAGTDESIAFQVEAVSDPIPLMESQLEAFFDRATPEGEQCEADVPVFIAQTVIDEVSALAEEAGDKETGGVLVGRLHRDSSTPEIFIEVVAQIPAKHAEATGTSFSFTHETWAAADTAIELRGRGEIILGWHHTHPIFCNPACPEERRKACVFGRPFFSAEDIHLHRVCFPHPYQIALLISDLPDVGSTPALFGWRSGVVSARGYYAVS